MIQQIINTLILFITPIVSYFIVNCLVNYNKKVDLKTSCITIIILIIVNCLCYNPEYNILSSIVIFACSVAIFSLAFKLEITRSTIVVSIMMLIILLSDFVTSILLMPYNMEDIRNNSLIWFLSNVLCGTISIGIVLVPSIRNWIIDFLNKLDNAKIPKIIVFLMLAFIILCLLIYVIFCNYHFGIEYIISIITSVIFISLVILFIKEQLEYGKLNREYQSFIDYVTTLEEWIEKEQLNQHEYKNHLAILRPKIKDPEALKFIDEKLANKLQIEERWMNELKNIPRGGLKGLIYYKIILAKNKKINFTISISKNTTNLLKKIKGNDFKDICHLIGIFLDNALEAAKVSKMKAVSLEIYLLNNKLNFVISNSYKEKIDLEKLGKKGYTTHGEGHGNGLYFAQKIIDKNPKINQKRLIAKNIYVQKFTI